MVDAKLRRLARTGVAAAAMVGLLAAGPAASAEHRDDRHHPRRAVVARGHCSGDSVWRLVLIERHRRIVVGFQVKSGVADEVWRVRLVHNGHLFFLDLLETGENGSFGIRRPTRNAEGADAYRARARNLETGEVCAGGAAIR